jgi:flagellin-like hook-associated protein FlgL
MNTENKVPSRQESLASSEFEASEVEIGPDPASLDFSKGQAPSISRSNIISLQQTVGNKAVQRLISDMRSRQTLAGKSGQVVMRNGDKDKPVTPAPEAPIPAATVAGPLTAADVRSVADIDRLSTEAIAAINPESMEPYHILHNVLHESWHEAKELLAVPKVESAEIKVKRQAVMRKLWEYRKWHHDKVLEATKTEVNKSHPGDAALEIPPGLEKWGSAGSDTLTSDIDVNLKGSATELAVKVFNKKFKEGVPGPHKWTYEAGVVYDVNVYALDFMHGVNKDNSAKFEEGGFSDGNEGVRDKDTHDQNIWSMVKMRLYMTPAEWASYKKVVKVSPADAEEAEERYQNYMVTLQKKMAKEARVEDLPELEADESKSGIKEINAMADALAQGKGASHQENEAIQENIKMGASNRVYEEKLAIIGEKRSQLRALKGLLKRADAVERPNLLKRWDNLLLSLRNLLSEASLYSNEAYITGGSITHTVVGTQMGVALKQTKAEAMQAVIENIGDALKEIARHNASLGEAAYKSGKYIFRLGDAARNLGLRSETDASGEAIMDEDAFHWFVETIYEAGFVIATEIKGGDRTQEQNEEEAGKVASAKLGVNTPEELAGRVATAGEVIAQVYQKFSEVQKKSPAQPVKFKEKVIGEDGKSMPKTVRSTNN